MRVFVELYHLWYKNIQQWWFDVGLVLKSVIYGVFFYKFPLILKVFMNIHEYANSVICILGHGMKGICLNFNLVPILVVYGKYQLRYDWICMYIPTCKNCFTGYHGDHAILQGPNVFIFQKHGLLIHGVSRNYLAPMQNFPWDAR